MHSRNKFIVEGERANLILIWMFGKRDGVCSESDEYNRQVNRDGQHHICLHWNDSRKPSQAAEHSIISVVYIYMCVVCLLFCVLFVTAHMMYKKNNMTPPPPLLPLRPPPLPNLNGRSWA